MIIFRRQSCSKCHKTTVLALVTQSPAGFNIRTFECPACNQVHQTVAPTDPMQSTVIKAWLRGQLTPPN